MNTNSKLLLIVGISILVILVSAIVLMPKNSVRTDLEPFAECIADSGAKFYGAFWCSHCQNQKELFGSAKNKLPYIECSTADGQGQLPECTEKGVASYPTWHFADGSVLTGEVALEVLAEKTQCSLPEGN